MAVTAQFSDTPKIGNALITGTSAINTARDGSGTEGTNIFQCFAAGTNGSRIDRVIVSASGTLNATTAGMVRFYISNGTTKMLWREWAVTAVTPSNSAVGYTNLTTSKIDEGLVLPTGYSLWVSASVVDALGNQFAVTVQGGDF